MNLSSIWHKLSQDDRTYIHRAVVWTDDYVEKRHLQDLEDGQLVFLSVEMVLRGLYRIRKMKLWSDSGPKSNEFKKVEKLIRLMNKELHK